MARIDVVMPQMGESIAEGTLSKWLKKVGDSVKRDEPMFEISTDKVDAEIPAPASGVLAEILVKEGQTVPVRPLVARLETDVNAAIAAPAAPAAAPAAASTRRGRREVAAAPARRQPSQASPSHPAAAPHQSAALRTPFPTATAPPSRSAFARSRRRSCGAWPRSTASRSPVCRAAGIAGRVTKKDLLEFTRVGREAPARAPRVGGGTPVHVGVAWPLPEPWPGDVVEPMSKMRALISEHMVASRHTSAHVSSFFEVDFTRDRAHSRQEPRASSSRRRARSSPTCRSSSKRSSTA